MSATALRLYEHVEALEVVRAWLDEHEDEIIAAGGELPPELEALLDGVTLAIEAKVEAVALVIREMLANAHAVKSEADRLAARVKHYERAADGLKGYLLHQLQRAEIPKVEGTLVTVAVQKSPPAVRSELSQEQLATLRYVVGRGYIDVLPEQYKLNAREVIADWKAGEALPDGITVEQGNHIRIR